MSDLALHFLVKFIDVERSGPQSIAAMHFPSAITLVRSSSNALSIGLICVQATMTDGGGAGEFYTSAILFTDVLSG